MNCKLVDFNTKTNFGVMTFINEVDFKESIFATEASFSFATFENKANFYFVSFKKISFNSATFKNEACFIDTTFTNKAYFSNATFASKTDFINTTFENEAKFDDTTFNEVTFGFTTFTNVANFNFASFNRAMLVFIHIESTLSFKNIKLSKGSYMSFSNINYIYNDETEKYNFVEPHKNSEITITNTIINGRIDFDNVKIKKINFEGSNVIGDGVVNRINCVADCVNWETARFLKHEEIKRDNIIKALEYKAIEKNLYQNELAPKKYKSIQLWAEWASIELSKLSNNHGQNWVKAVFFTILSGFVCFTIFYAPNPIIQIFGDGELHTTWSGYLHSLAEYYIPINYEVLIEYLADSQLPLLIKICGLVVYFLGKIAVAYGMVEIVQAFRKLK